MTRLENDDIVVIRRRMVATREEVFKEWTNPEGMAAWMCPDGIVSAAVQLDARVGGALRIVMRTETEAFEHWGEFTIVDPPAKLAFTWCAAATDFQPSLVTVELLEAENKHCDLILTHERLRRPEIRNQYRGGWEGIVTRLQARLAVEQRG